MESAARSRRPLVSSPSLQCSEHSSNSRSQRLSIPSPTGCFCSICLWRSTLTRRGTPLASLDAWRVASPTTTPKHSGWVYSLYVIHTRPTAGEPLERSNESFGEVILRIRRRSPSKTDSSSLRLTHNAMSISRTGNSQVSSKRVAPHGFEQFVPRAGLKTR